MFPLVCLQMYSLAFFQLNLILLFFAHIANLSRGPYASSAPVPKSQSILIQTFLPHLHTSQKSQAQQTASLIYNQLCSSVIGTAPGLAWNHHHAISQLRGLQQGGSTLGLNLLISTWTPVITLSGRNGRRYH